MNSFISDFNPLAGIDLSTLGQNSLRQARQEINLTVTILQAYCEEVESLRPIQS